jgi:D-sedoheptulose 7-phosphate isomerase
MGIKTMKLIDPEKIQRRAQLLAGLNEDPQVGRAIDLLAAALQKSSHFAAELVNKFYFRRQALPVLALNADMANVTSIANDEDFQFIFSRQVEAFGSKGDVALGITTSGKSANVLQALAKARERGMLTIALAGSQAQRLREVPVDVLVVVDAQDTPTIQEMHLFLLHVMAETIEKKLFGGKHG